MKNKSKNELIKDNNQYTEKEKEKLNELLNILFN